MAPGIPSSHLQSNETLSTLPDPRSPLTSPELSRSSSTSPPHPELSNEVAALSNKLIHAINHQTDLDDTLNATRHQLDSAQERSRQLELLVQEHKSLVTNGILIMHSDVENELLRLKTTLANERRQRVKEENDRKAIEQELETLTTALFEEANQMVAAARQDARKEREFLERRNDQLQAQLNDAELLLASHQEQLAELKLAMQEMCTQRIDLDGVTNASTTPSTPAMDHQDQMSKIWDALNLSPLTPGGDDIPPAPPTSFTHLFHPVLRTDTQAYDEFHLLLEMSRKSQSSSRVTSGTFNGLGLGHLTNNTQPHILDRMPSTSSTSSFSTSNIHPSTPSTPNLSNSASSSFSSRDLPGNGIPLRETIFYKRILTEDVEPTLRLDTAPGLSWLARRTVINSMCEGMLIVEPTPAAARLYHPPCTLCGEQRREDKYSRTHRFRTSDSETAQRYPLCNYCLGRVRASCDFLGFLRMIKDGHWPTNGAHAEAVAWEESVRLRERMFWSRVGGGVVPAFLRTRDDTPRSSVEEEKGVPTVINMQNNIGGQDTKSAKSPSSIQETTVEETTAFCQGSPSLEDAEYAQAVVAFQEAKSAEHALAPQDTTFDRSSSFEAVKDAFTNYGMPSSVSRTPTRPRGFSRSETTIKGSVARRAAMFERTSSEDTAPRQLQTSLHESLRGRSPIGRSPSPAAIRSPRSETSTMGKQHDDDTLAIASESFDL